MPGSPVASVRAVNRFYTRVIGTLAEGLLGSPYTLTEVRVLFELAQRDQLPVTELRRELGLDAGYLSRFSADGLVDRSRADHDGRQQLLRLTDQGRQVFADLDRRSADQIDGLISGLGDSVQRHGTLYSQEYGWDETFEALVARIVADFVERHDPKREAAWIAEVDGEPAGCVLCVGEDADTAKLRVLLVEPWARGMGVGSRLVTECLDFARRAGYRRMVLTTNDVLHAARRIYERAGFKRIGGGESHEHELVNEHWERTL